MKILMFTNTYTPHVGGVARSVSELAAGLRDAGDEVLVVAPEFENRAQDEAGVLRMPAVQHFAGSDFSVPLPLSPGLARAAEAFGPDIIHSHHPFLLGDTALRAASYLNVPVVFTHHTRYELYGHYVAQDSDLLKRLALNLSLGYCDLCDGVIAPSASIADFLAEHGVDAPVNVVPTGVDARAFGNGQADRGRTALSIPSRAFVIGHVGRLAPEKNLGFLTEALLDFLRQNVEAHVLIVGDGPSRTSMGEEFDTAGVSGRVHLAGVLTGKPLADAYAAMNVFAFSSLSETQGLVLVEAMTAGCPVVALDAPGARDVVVDGLNGRLLDAGSTVSEFATVLGEMATMAGMGELAALEAAARKTAAAYTIERTVARTRAYYQEVLKHSQVRASHEESLWARVRRALAKEIDIFGNIAHAAAEAVMPDENGAVDRKDG